jgi:hypothetical protein
MPKCIYLRMGKESKCRLADYDQGGPERARTGVAMNSQGRSMRETAEALGHLFVRSQSATVSRQEGPPQVGSAG